MRHIYTASNIEIPKKNVYQDISNMFNEERMVSKGLYHLLANLFFMKDSL